MKKWLIVLLVSVLLIVSVVWCNKDNSVEVSDDVFGNIYSLSKEDILTQIMFIPSEVPLKSHRLTQEQFKEFYEALIEINCKNSYKGKMVTTKKRSDYTVSFTIKMEEKNRWLHFNVGESFILVTKSGEREFIYKHQINKEDYIKLKRMLEELKKSL